MTERNRKLLYEVAQQIEEDPESYDQTTPIAGTNTRCKTVACIGGWAAILCDSYTVEIASSGYLAYDSNTKNPIPVLFGAGEALGLTGKERNILFNAAWKPVTNLTVPDALRKFADGASIEEVTG